MTPRASPTSSGVKLAENRVPALAAKARPSRRATALMIAYITR